MNLSKSPRRTVRLCAACRAGAAKRRLLKALGGRPMFFHLCFSLYLVEMPSSWP